VEGLKADQSQQWLQASSGNEAMKFIKHGSWRNTLFFMQEGCQLTGTEWVYKKKDKQDGSIRYKGHIMSLHADSWSTSIIFAS
jgi:hypothetical protein